MKITKNRTKGFAFALAGLFALTGTYNAFVINSGSELHETEVKYSKRLDEIYGVVVHGREVAGSKTWKTLGHAKVKHPNTAKIAVSNKVEPLPSDASVETIPAASVKEELTLSLVEVINPKKWQQGLTADKFNGSLLTSSGVIENLTVSLPNGEGVSVSFSEMTGNVFDYDLNGEIFSGMMYQVDQNAYMVTLTNGPLEGTRLRFSAHSPSNQQAETHELLAEKNIETGNFGDTLNPEALVQNDQEIQAEAIESQGFQL